ncbi:hypothetical protein [Hymenobacter mucosus]|uniref:hypothetical protein n=1 Tax=Hymenobacter mucosus TaxID=1411120 RepID=UPI00117AD93B|nr:hypothetical protein [Hymenobacter mucosus]
MILLFREIFFFRGYALTVQVRYRMRSQLGMYSAISASVTSFCNNISIRSSWLASKEYKATQVRCRQLKVEAAGGLGECDDVEFMFMPAHTTKPISLDFSLINFPYCSD